MTRALEVLKLIRCVNCLLAAVGVLVGAAMTWVVPTYYGPVVAALSAFLICAAGNIVNDLVDEDVDRTNHPDRVLVRGAISRRSATNLAVVVHLLAMVVALAVSVVIAMTAAAIMALLFVYNLWLKRLPLAGNVLVAVLAALTFVIGGLAVNPHLTLALPGPLIAAVFAFFFHLVREIVKDVQDIEGDRRIGMRTLPHVIGVQKSLSLALALFVVLVLLTYLPILLSWFSAYYQVIAVYVVDLPLLLLLILVWGNPSRSLLRAGSVGLKAGMVLGLVALMVA